jgi:hypothetical protein
MANPIIALKWRICGHYSSQESVTEDAPVRALNRAKYEAWKYNTFGPGRNIFSRDKDFVYRIIDSGELQGEPLHVNDPHAIAGLASIIAEMEGHSFIAMMTPVGAHITEKDVERKEDEAIERWVNYDNTPQSIRETLQDKIIYDNKLIDNSAIKLFGIPWYYKPSEQDIAQSLSVYREDQKQHFKEMLGKLKRHNNP